MRHLNEELPTKKNDGNEGFVLVEKMYSHFRDHLIFDTCFFHFLSNLCALAVSSGHGTHKNWKR